MNMAIVMLGYRIMPLPGIDPNDMEALAAAMPDFEPAQFAFPLLAHALGTLVGAFIAALIARNKAMNMAMIVGFLFLLGGIAASFMLPAPLWFILTDLILAYIPMAWLGGKIALSLNRKSRTAA